MLERQRRGEAENSREEQGRGEERRRKDLGGETGSEDSLRAITRVLTSVAGGGATIGRCPQGEGGGRRKGGEGGVAVRRDGTTKEEGEVRMEEEEEGESSPHTLMSSAKPCSVDKERITGEGLICNPYFRLPTIFLLLLLLLLLLLHFLLELFALRQSEAHARTNAAVEIQRERETSANFALETQKLQVRPPPALP
eukprot:357319-Hanusia_phi.AAC.2